MQSSSNKSGAVPEATTDAMRSFVVAFATAVYLLAGYAFGSVVSGNAIPNGTATLLLSLGTFSTVSLFFDSLAKRVPDLENQLKGIAFVSGAILIGFGLL